ncbi:hypothetical protein OG302_04355 [Streptomyces sp. NBC_01283]|uniref:hypothetical protein n=1 Tax=Streptomyces sp. NBC_01283 TaxID=2903812 RepID=UPI00352D86DF|nr:hypothetical protein OG302_04355 [Streptomyces sp. NBC_01283]
MTKTTPPRPLDVEALFPELAAYRGTTTRLHPRPGSPDVTASSVGGPMLWPADEPWPVCPEAHPRRSGRRPADIHRRREILDRAWAHPPFRGPSEEDRQLLDELDRRHRIPGLSDTDPLPLVALAQLYRRDIPDLSAGPDDCDLLQVFCCPFDAHGPTRYGMLLHLRWRRSAEVGEVLASPPQPQVVGSDGYVPEPCVLQPEQVVTYPFAGLLPEDLCERIYAREDALEEALEAALEEQAEQERTEEHEYEGEGGGGDDDGLIRYQYDLSIPPGWRVGGFASWHTTDPSPMNCLTCTTPMQLLLTIDSSEWDGGSGSWKPTEERDLTPHPFATPTKVIVGRAGEANIFACPTDPGHPHRWSIQ